MDILIVTCYPVTSYFIALSVGCHLYIQLYILTDNGVTCFGISSYVHLLSVVSVLSPLFKK